MTNAMVSIQTSEQEIDPVSNAVNIFEKLQEPHDSMLMIVDDVAKDYPTKMGYGPKIKLKTRKNKSKD